MSTASRLQPSDGVPEPHGWRAAFRGVRALLFGGNAAMVFVLLVGLVAAFSSTQVLSTNFTHTVNTVDALSTAQAQGIKLLEDEETSLRGYLLTGDKTFLQPYTAASHELPPILARVERLLAGDARGHALLESILKDGQAWATWATPYLHQSPTQARTSPGFAASMLHGKVLFDQFRQSSDRLSVYLEEQRTRSLRESLTAVDRTGGILFWVLVGTVGLMVVIAWLTSRGITRSLDRLGYAAKVISLGDLEQPIAASGAIEFARLGRSMDHMRRQLLSQRALGEILGSSLHLDDVFTQLVAGVRELTPFDRLSVSLIDDDGDTMVTAYATGVASEQIMAGTRRAVAQSVTGKVFQTQRMLVRADLTTLSPTELFDDERVVLQQGIRSLAMVPLFAKGKVIGTLGISSLQAGTYSAEALGPIAGLAPLIGAALDNAQLYRSLDDANVALAQASEVKSRFLASMSHELRTPLNAIIGFSEVLADGTFGPLNERQQRYVGNVLQSGRHLLDLVNDLLDLSKVEAGQMTLYQETLDVYALLADAGQTILPLARQKQIALKVAQADHPEPVFVDRKRCIQILYNLLSNAVKFTPEHGSVTVSCTVRPQEVAIAVTDSGIGIAVEDQARIFNAFHQVESTMTRSQQGTGLGLALARQLAALHGGALTVQSAEGQGSTFTFTVPRALTVAERPDAAELVLVVEDHASARELLSLYLQETGYSVAFVERLDDLVPQARTLQPAAITLDVLFGDEVAWPVLAALREDPLTRDIPVVIVTIVDDQQATGFALGAASYLVKPVARQDLLDAVSRAVGGRHPVRVLAVDDQPEALELVALALEGGPYELLRATNGADALALLGQSHPDVLIVDLFMTPMSGFDLIAAVAADQFTSDIPMIVLTAHELTAADIARLNGRVAAVLPKTGFKKAQFVHEVQRAVQSRKAREVRDARA
jgi:signal transduction histidine kinase/CheY-like chemotaxis protein/CHASE3 domain sensor protein